MQIAQRTKVCSAVDGKRHLAVTWDPALKHVRNDGFRRGWKRLLQSDVAAPLGSAGFKRWSLTTAFSVMYAPPRLGKFRAIRCPDKHRLNA